MEAGIYRCPPGLFSPLLLTRSPLQISSPMHDQLYRPGGPEMFVNGKCDYTRASGPVASWSKASPDPNCSLQTLTTHGGQDSICRQEK